MSPPAPDAATRPEWLPDAALAGLVGLVGLVEAARTANELSLGGGSQILVALAMAGAAGCFRRAPAIALSLIWIGCGIQVVSAAPVMLVELVSVLVAYGCARHGSATVLWLSGVSIPLGAVIALWYQLPYGLPSYALQPRLDVGGLSRYGFYAFAGVTALLLLALPWLLGLLLRSRAVTKRSLVDQQVAETEREQAEEIARLRAAQAQLAHDVHDVVGHSLAVILAQAESAQYLPDHDTERIKQTLANIATSARTSLGEVRQVLAGTDERRTPAAVAALDSLVEGVRAAGNEVESVVVGTPQPLPPELDAVAFRVLQEMLTNALKHGRRGEPIQVERHWEGDLRIEVRNVSADAPAEEETKPMVLRDEPAEPADRSTGLGVDGMRRRLESVGGRLDVRRRRGPHGLTWTATAWVPLRPVSHD